MSLDKDILERCKFILEQLPENGLFAGHNWLISVEPFFIPKQLFSELERLGRILLQFYKASNFLYYSSLSGKAPRWVSELLDLGKPETIIEIQRKQQFKNELPRVIRPDLLLTENGIVLTELDNVPGGIGLTAWLNKTYSLAERGKWRIIGGLDEMVNGFSSIFGESRAVKIIVSEESATYLPEMIWMANQLPGKFSVQNTEFSDFRDVDAVYRFFELFDYKNIKCFESLINLFLQKKVYITPPLKAFLEEKMLFAFLWNKNLSEFWRRELGEAFFDYLNKITPYTWLLDPTPIPPHAAIPRLEITNWDQLKLLSQKKRQLILKISGFSELAWGARGVYLGSDMSGDDWAHVVELALKSFNKNPYVLQEYHKPKRVKVAGFDPQTKQFLQFEGRVRLSPYYFVSGDWNNARARLCGALATICPADKKIIHGMRDAILAPCAISD